MPRLTVLIPCKNELANIRACIESAWQIADEVLIADSGSTDGTLEAIAQMENCRVIQREYIHSGDFKNWAIPQAAHEWVFILDADERITPELAHDVREQLASGPPVDGYWVKRDNYFLGHLIRHSGWGTSRLIRLFKRDLGRYVGQTDHASIVLPSGSLGHLKARLTHFTFWSYDQYFSKLDRYSIVQAKVWHSQGRRPSLIRLFSNAPLRFLRSFVLQWGFLDGLAGFQVCMLHGIYSFLKQARLWELHFGLPQPDPEANRRPRAD